MIAPTNCGYAPWIFVAPLPNKIYVLPYPPGVKWFSRFVRFDLDPVFCIVTTMKHEHNDEAEAFLDQPHDGENTPTITTRKISTWVPSWSYIRVVLEIAMAATIVFLLFFRGSPSRTIRRSPVPDCM